MTSGQNYFFTALTGSYCDSYRKIMRQHANFGRRKEMIELEAKHCWKQPLESKEIKFDADLATFLTRLDSTGT